MFYEQIDLNLDYEAMGLPAPAVEGRLTAYCVSSSPEIFAGPRPAVLILPGGGYVMTSDREAEPVALALAARGVQAFVLRYAVAPDRHPLALVQAAAAMARIRSLSGRYNIDPDKIAIGGFSAGGHLAGSLGVFWNQPWLSSLLRMDAESYRPNFLLLSYPVISSGPYGHHSSFENLSGSQDRGEHSKYSLEEHAGPDVPPTFLWHTDPDLTVPVENALLFAAALKRHKVPLELHIYDVGGHGLSLANELSMAPDGYAKVDAAAGWLELFVAWLKRQN